MNSCMYICTIYKRYPVDILGLLVPFNSDIARCKCSHECVHHWHGGVSRAMCNWDRNPEATVFMGTLACHLAEEDQSILPHCQWASLLWQQLPHVWGDKYIPCKKGINRKLWHSIKAQQIVWYLSKGYNYLIATVLFSLLYAIVNVLCMCALVLLADWSQFGLVPCVQWSLQFAHMVATYFISGVRHAFYIIRTYA